MTRFKCFDVIKPVIDDVTNEQKNRLVLSEEKTDSIVAVCELVDCLLDTYEGVGLSVEIDDGMNIHITTETNDLIVRGECDTLFSLMDKAKIINFSPSEGNNLLTEYVFDGVWDVSETNKYSHINA